MRRSVLILLLTLGTIGLPGPQSPADEPAAEPGEKASLALDPGGHTDRIVAMAFTPPDGKELMTASLDGTVRFWDLETGETVQVLRPPILFLNAAALSPDGRTVAVGGRIGDTDRAVLLLNRSDDRMRVLMEHDNDVERIAFSPDGKRLASAGRRRSRDGSFTPGDFTSLRLWDLEEGEIAFAWKDDAAAAHDLAFSPDGKRIVTVADHGVCDVWEPGGKEPVDSIPGHEERVWGVAWSKDGKRIATSGEDGVRLWDVEGRTSTVLSRQFCRQVHACFSGDATKLLYWAPPFEDARRGGRRPPGDWPAAYETLRVAMVRDLATGVETVFPGPVHELTAAALSKDGTLAATAGGVGHEVFLWRTAAPMQGYRRLGGQAVLKSAVALSPDGKTIAWGERDVSPDEAFRATAPLQWSFSFADLAVQKLPPDGKPADLRRADLRRDGLSLEVHADHKGVDVLRDGKVVSTHPFLFAVVCATLLPNNRLVVGTRGTLRLLAADGPDDNICLLRGHTDGVSAAAATADGRWLVTAGLDSAVRLWDLAPLDGPTPPKELRPTLSLFAAGPDCWIAWTPEGYYAASPNGEQVMGWVKDNGPDRQLSFYSADQFRKSLYRPGAIRALLSEGSLEKALQAQGEREVAPLQAPDILPPAVAVVEPADGAILGAPGLTVRATAEKSGADDVTGFQLLVDGRPFPSAAPELARDPKSGKVEAKWQIKAPPGRHRLSALAQTKTSEGRSGPVVFTNTAPPPPPRLFFLGVGIDAYKNVPRLGCAVNDVTALEQALEARQKVAPLFGGLEARLLLNEKATPGEILAALDWLTTADPDDVVVIFYAGHGERDDAGEFRLLTADYTAATAATTAVNGADLKKRLRALQARQVLMLLDACHSGSIATDALAGELKQPDCGVTVLCAAQGQESSLESAKDGHGYFTKWLLDGLRGGAGANDAGEVTLARLYVHVEEKVPAETEDRQHPVLVGLTAIRSFPLAKAPKAANP